MSRAGSAGEYVIRTILLSSSSTIRADTKLLDDCTCDRGESNEEQAALDTDYVKGVGSLTGPDIRYHTDEFNSIGE